MQVRRIFSFFHKNSIYALEIFCTFQTLNDLHPKNKINSQSIYLLIFFSVYYKSISKNVLGSCVQSVHIKNKNQVVMKLTLVRELAQCW